IRAALAAADETQINLVVGAEHARIRRRRQCQGAGPGRPHYLAAIHIGGIRHENSIEWARALELSLRSGVGAGRGSARVYANYMRYDDINRPALRMGPTKNITSGPKDTYGKAGTKHPGSFSKQCTQGKDLPDNLFD